jgi:hypothetical protein
MSEYDTRKQDELTTVTRLRLQRLASVQVDTSRLERRLDAALAADERSAAQSMRVVWARRVVAAAAMLLLAFAAFMVVDRSARPVLAEPFELTDLHQRLVHEGAGLAAAWSVAEANRRIAVQATDGPVVPGLAATRALYVRSCCLAHVRGRLVAAVLMEADGQAVTLVVAEARDFAGPVGQVIERDGRRLLAHRLNDLDMVVTRNGDRWLCVMGDAGHVSRETLVEIAAAAEF